MKALRTRREEEQNQQAPNFHLPLSEPQQNIDIKTSEKLHPQHIP